MKNSRTIIRFDCEGYYAKNGDDIRWNPKEDHVYTLVMKGSLEEFTYCELVDRICKKITVDENKTRLKLSYIPLLEDPKRQTYILDDEDVLGYLMEGDKNHRRDILHVEFIEDVTQNQSNEPISRADIGSGVYVRNDEIASHDRVNDDIIAPITEFETQEHYLLLENAPHISNGENDPCEEVVTVDENVDDNDLSIDVNTTHDVQADEIVYLEWEDGIDLTLGQEFESKQVIKDLVEKALHQNYFQFATIKSTPELYVLKCRASSCKWSLRVAKLKYSNRFSVRTYNKIHTCSRVTTSTNRNKRRGTPRLVASILHEDYPGVFDTPTPKNLISLVQGKLGVKVSYSTALRGKNQAASDVRGSPEESYMMLPSYLHMLKKMNDDTVTHVECDEKGKFKYLFIALGACIEGFQAMRKVIIVDGTHLKTVYGGVLLIATAQDPDRHHYPLAFGVVDGEKDASWRWFLNMLKTVVPDNPEIVFVSDRNSSIIKTICEVYPKSQHGYCIFHLSQNVKSHVYGVDKEFVAEKFRECAQVYTEAEFIPLYDSFRKQYPKAADYLDDSVYENKWARCYFPGERYNIDTTNCCESMNNVFKDARKYSLLPMIDVIVAKVGEWFNKYRKKSGEFSSSQKLVPFVAGVLHQRCQDAKLLPVCELNSFLREYNVIGRDGKSYLVDLSRKTCTCKYFDIDSYPCDHAIAAAMMHSETTKEFDLHELCSKYYLIEQWALAYYRTIYPVPHKCEWKIPDDIQALCVLPPDFEKKKGRNQETRFPSVGEFRRRSKRSIGRFFSNAETSI